MTWSAMSPSREKLTVNDSHSGTSKDFIFSVWRYSVIRQEGAGYHIFVSSTTAGLPPPPPGPWKKHFCPQGKCSSTWSSRRRWCIVLLFFHKLQGNSAEIAFILDDEMTQRHHQLLWRREAKEGKNRPLITVCVSNNQLQRTAPISAKFGETFQSVDA